MANIDRISPILLLNSFVYSMHNLCLSWEVFSFKNSNVSLNKCQMENFRLDWTLSNDEQKIIVMKTGCQGQVRCLLLISKLS